jgi:light-regulated signal transduction histidine kinase (bacteriophytochrome)
MVSSYTRLLGEEYGHRLDENARLYMGFVTDGAQRLQQLVDDLLAYSRAGTQPHSLCATSMDTCLQVVLRHLQARLDERGAQVQVTALPEVFGDAKQISVLLEHLLANAITFCGDAPPRIDVSAKAEGDCWMFRVHDNGIGIESRYFDEIFQVFRRLHRRDQYTGTGIGLAICKRIVERMHGRIWVESEPLAGSTFCFTLPAAPPRRVVG